jgi:hypothetical protein
MAFGPECTFQYVASQPAFDQKRVGQTKRYTQVADQTFPDGYFFGCDWVTAAVLSMKGNTDDFNRNRN